MARSMSSKCVFSRLPFRTFTALSRTLGGTQEFLPQVPSARMHARAVHQHAHARDACATRAAIYSHFWLLLQEYTLLYTYTYTYIDIQRIQYTDSMVPSFANFRLFTMHARASIPVYILGRFCSYMYIHYTPTLQNILYTTYMTALHQRPAKVNTVGGFPRSSQLARSTHFERASELQSLRAVDAVGNWGATVIMRL